MKAFVIKNPKTEQYYCGGKDYYAANLARAVFYSTKKAAEKVANDPSSKARFSKAYGEPIVISVKITEIIEPVGERGNLGGNDPEWWDEGFIIDSIFSLGEPLQWFWAYYDIDNDIIKSKWRGPYKDQHEVYDAAMKEVTEGKIQ